MKPLDLLTIAAIRETVRGIDPDDTGLLADMIEGETDAGELLDDLLESEAATKAYIAANKERINDINARIQRLEARVSSYRAGMQKLLGAAGLRKMERASATVSLKAVPPKVEGSDITGLPERCVVTKTTYSPDRAAIKAALEAGEVIEGWHLTNGGETISIRRG